MIITYIVLVVASKLGNHLSHIITTEMQKLSVHIMQGKACRSTASKYNEVRKQLTVRSC